MARQPKQAFAGRPGENKGLAGLDCHAMRQQFGIREACEGAGRMIPHAGGRTARNDNNVIIRQGARQGLIKQAGVVAHYAMLCGYGPDAFAKRGYGVGIHVMHLAD